MSHDPTQRRSGPSLCGAQPLPDPRPVLALMASTLFLLLVLALPALGQSTGATRPDNASAERYGDGWACDIGFRQIGATCAAVIVPQNAYPTNRSYGDGWACRHGFVTSEDGECLPVAVPAGGFLDPSGERWRCMRGFLKVGETCQKIDLPENAYLVAKSFGSTWDCNRGFEARDDNCIAIEVPENAFLNTSTFGQRWTCERGFRRQEGRCDPVVIPDNAYFDDATYGTGWLCDRGFERFDGGCVAITLPANAHLDRSGNRWECNDNFQKSKGRCLLGN